jgi:hypothetical protein
MPKLAIEMSHERPRTTLRLDEGQPLPESAQTLPMNDKTSGRFLKGNQAWRCRQLKQRAEGICTLNPAKVPSWMRPHVEQGATYVAALLAFLEGKPALHPLAGDCADAHTLYRALLGLSLATEDAKERAALLSEARGWLREHRTALATLSALAGDVKLSEPDPHAAIRAIAKENGK